MLLYLFTAVLAVIIFFGYKFLNQQGPTKLKIPESVKTKEKTAKPKQQTKKKSNSGSSTPTTTEAKKEAVKEEKKETNNKKEDKKEQKKVEQPKVVLQEKEDKKEAKKTKKQEEAPKTVATEEKKQEAKPDVVTKEEKKELTTASKKSAPVQDKEEKKDQKQQKKEKKPKTDEQEKGQKPEAPTKSKLKDTEKQQDTVKEQAPVAANPVVETHTAPEKDESDVVVAQKAVSQKFKTVKAKQYSPKVSSPEETPKVVEKKERTNFRSEKPKPKEEKEEKKEEPKISSKSFTDQDYQVIAKEKLESEKKRKDVGVSKKDAGPEVKIFAPVASTKTWSKPEDTTEVTSIDETYFPKLGEKKSKSSTASKQTSTSTIDPHQDARVENPHKRGGELSFEIMIQAPDEKRMKRSNPEEEEHLIPVNFHCTIDPADQSYDSWQMYVIGTCPELGDYKIENGLTMDRSGNVFTATLECFESDEIEYQYAFVDSSDNSKVKYSEKRSFKVNTEPKELRDVFTLQ